MEPHRYIAHNRNKHIDLPAGRQDSMWEPMFLYGIACPDNGRVVQKDCRIRYPDSYLYYLFPASLQPLREMYLAVLQIDV